MSRYGQRFSIAPRLSAPSLGLPFIAAQIVSAACMGTIAVAGDTVPCTTESSPRISISGARLAGSFYSDDMVVTGRVTGRCLKSAGVFEGDTEVAQIPLGDSCRGEISKDFSIKIDASLEPEIRAYTHSGKTQRLKIDVLDYRS